MSSSWICVIIRSSDPKSVHFQRDPILHLAALDDSTVAVVDSWGTLRILETGLATIHRYVCICQKQVRVIAFPVAIHVL